VADAGQFAKDSDILLRVGTNASATVKAAGFFDTIVVDVEAFINCVCRFDFVAADRFEDYTIPRIPVCRKLTNCRMSAVHHNFLPFVYMSVAPHVTVMPSVDLVFDAPETAERWIIPPPEDHSFICVCKLKRRVKMMVEKIINPAYFALMQEDQKKLGLDLIL